MTVSKTAVKLEKAEDKIDDLKEALKEEKKTEKELEAEIKELKAEVKRLKAHHDKHTPELEEYHKWKREREWREARGLPPAV